MGLCEVINIHFRFGSALGEPGLSNNLMYFQPFPYTSTQRREPGKACLVPEDLSGSWAWTRHRRSRQLLADGQWALLGRMLSVVAHLNWIPTYPSPEGELEDPAAAPHGVTGGWGYKLNK